LYPSFFDTFYNLGKEKKVGVPTPLPKGGFYFMNYYNATSIAEALELLKNAEGARAIIAGGSDVIVDRDAGKKNYDSLVDIMGVEEMHDIWEDDNSVAIGAAVTLTEIARSPIIKKYYPSLAQGCGSVGSLQIRNSATLVGNVVSAQPAADGAMALAPLDPSFTIVDVDGKKRSSDMNGMYAGFGKSAVDPSRELVTKITIPKPEKNSAAAFQRLELRKSLSLPMLNAAAMAKVEKGKFVWARITMGPVGVGPVRAEEAEKWLVGKPANEETFAEAGKLALKNASPRSNPLRGSKEFREETLPVLVKRALADVCAQIERGNA
jgi:carbon-monoxide dehydrogenase medium subunit